MYNYKQSLLHNITILDTGSFQTSTPCSSSTLLIDKSDIGNLLESGIDIHHNLMREEMYLILTCEPNMDPTSYSYTRPQSTGAYRQFQPTWLKQYSWLHYSR